MRRRWLDLSDEGFTIDRIAERETEGEQPDPRTVKKHIEKARSERERGDIQRAVYLEAVQAHQADLIGVATRLRQALKGPERAPWMVTSIEQAAGDENRLQRALQQHLRAPTIGQYINRWNQACAEFGQNRLGLQARAKAAAEQAGLFVANKAEGMVILLRQDAGYRLSGLPLVDLLYDPIAGQAGAYALPQAPEEAAQEMRRRFQQLRNELAEWPEFKHLQKTFDRALRIREELDDELAVVVLRRVVPGECRLCPLYASPERRKGG